MDLIDIQELEFGDVKDYFPELAEDGAQLILHMGLGLVGEAGEIANDLKKWHRGDFDVSELVDRMGKELPDVLIYLVLLAGALNINLEEVWEIKKEFNDARYRRPGLPPAPE